jgi:hypothetical protein
MTLQADRLEAKQKIYLLELELALREVRLQRSIPLQTSYQRTEAMAEALA